MKTLHTLTHEQKKVDGMDELDRLKQVGAPKLAAAKEDQNEKIEACIILLDRICTLKEEQQVGDIKFRNKWAKAKLNDTRISLILLALANVAIYLDVIKINAYSPFVEALSNGLSELGVIFSGLF